MFHIATPVYTLSGLQTTEWIKTPGKGAKLFPFGWSSIAVPMVPALPAKKMSNINETNNIKRNDTAQGRNDWDGQSGGNSTAKEITLKTDLASAPNCC
ncbi:hypothetical protein FCL47_12995 [Desulfopila sp. IMCC35006]|uniref:hypothetical protein n=1 Tax=Desulfopila sp. IMCC35006 TaxID=2569542 RepID=UPI0010AC267A|nr:hypothetical protein [Desulfopila sp. IMCC35006]TKB25457.1 hypothetical protein FCL47_12995 [Desulfopila sp. IMCC35006]